MILPSTTGRSLHVVSSKSSTLGCLGTRPRAGERDLPISDIGECDRDGEMRLTGMRPSSVNCLTTLVLETRKLLEQNTRRVDQKAQNFANLSISCSNLLSGQSDERLMMNGSPPSLGFLHQNGLEMVLNSRGQVRRAFFIHQDWSLSKSIISVSTTCKISLDESVLFIDVLCKECALTFVTSL